MKQIHFQKLSLTNFLSVGETPMEICFERGINLITSENLDIAGGKNGCGKSTILNGLYWIIFGETITGLKKQQIRHNLNEKGSCEGFLVFSDGENQYIIHRKLEPASLSLSKNGVDITLSAIPKTEELIWSLMGATPEIFQNVVTLTSDNTIPFMAQKKVEKRKFVEGIMNLGVFTQMLQMARSEYNDKKKDYDLEVSRLSGEFSNLKQFQQKKEDYDKEQKKLADEINAEISGLVAEMTKIGSEDNSEKIEYKKTELAAIENNMEDAASRIVAYREKIKGLESEIFSLQSDLKTFEEARSGFLSDQKHHKIKIEEKEEFLKKIKEKKGVCPSCRRPFSESPEDAEHSEKAIKETGEEISALKDILKKIGTELDEKNRIIEKQNKKLSEKRESIRKIEDFIKEIEKTTRSDKNRADLIRKEIEDLQNTKTKIQIIQTKIEKCRESLEKIKKKPNPFDELIEKQTRSIADIEKKVNEHSKSLKILENVKNVFSEDGVKTVIVKKILGFLNGRMDFYLKSMEAPCTCEFDDTFDEHLRNTSGKECSYYNFSGGERKRIDTAAIFAFQDVLRMYTGTRFSLSIYDELFDSALDEKGANAVLSILRDRVSLYGEAVYIISHNPQTIKGDIDRILVVEKSGGKSFLRN